MNELKVGFLALGAMGAIIFMSLMVTSHQSGLSTHVPYQTTLKDASGIFPRTPIRIAGIQSGRIKEIKLFENKALVIFEVIEGIKITKDSRLRVKSVGFLGDKYLEMVLGHSGEIVEEMGIVIAEEGGGFADIAKDAEEIMKDVKAIVKEIKQTLLPADRTSPIKNITEDIEEMLKTTRELAHTLKDIFDKEKMEQLFQDLEAFTRALRENMDIENDNSLLAGVDRILVNTEKLTEDLKGIVADLKSGKGTVGKFLVEEEIADEISKTLSGVNKLVGRANSIKTELAFFYRG